MSDTTARAKAQRAKNLAADPNFQEVIASVKEDLAAKFLDPTSSTEEVEEAHAEVRALQRIDSHIQRLINAETVVDYKQRKDRNATRGD